MAGVQGTGYLHTAKWSHKHGVSAPRGFIKGGAWCLLHYPTFGAISTLLLLITLEPLIQHPPPSTLHPAPSTFHPAPCQYPEPFPFTTP